MSMECLVLPWERQEKSWVGLTWLMGSKPSSLDNWIIYKQTRTSLEPSRKNTLTVALSWIHGLSRQTRYPLHDKGRWTHDIMHIKQACRPLHHRGDTLYDLLYCTVGKHTNLYNTTTLMWRCYNCRVVLKLVWQNTVSCDGSTTVWWSSN
jgi:hypothetical protein